MVPFKCVAIAITFQLFLSVSVNQVFGSEDEDLMDFDFEKNVKSPPNDTVLEEFKFDNAFDDFIDIIVEPVAEQGSHMQQKEERVKNKLVRAWDNPNMQRKFAEVLPILKVMTIEQKIALAALVSAQVGSKQGRELNLDQVRQWLGMTCIRHKIIANKMVIPCRG